MDICNKNFDKERALYNIQNTNVINCNFKGPSDGESVLKECRNFTVNGCSFSLRYPMWHAKKFELINSTMDDLTRAPIWYSSDGNITGCEITGVKCLRECKKINIENCEINSIEFGWRCKGVDIKNSNINAVYCLFESRDVNIDNIEMSGKYSFQYMKNLHIKNSKLDTKDAFWHSKNIVVENSIVKGEYLGWFSENLTLINCKIIGTQPLCYCKNLKLIDCEMQDTDLAFEYSDVDASIKGHIVSVKNPKSGIIIADSVGEVIMENAITKCKGKVQLRENRIEGEKWNLSELIQDAV